MTNRTDLIIHREFDGNPGIDAVTGLPLAERIIRLYPQKTVGMMRRAKNALVKWNGDGDTEVNVGDSEVARYLAAIHSWEGEGLTGREISIEGIESLGVDSFIEGVLKDILDRFGDKPSPKSPKELAAPTNGLLPNGSTSLMEPREVSASGISTPLWQASPGAGRPLS